MNFKNIFNGMVGRDFIKAFNDNFVIADETFLSILATLIYKVKSTDIKEFKVIDNVVSYTLEEEVEGEEDTREWIPVDITKWGNISGNIEDQLDLKAILDDKAALETVQTMDNILSTLNQNFTTLRGQVEADETLLRTTVNNTADLMEAIVEKVSSTNIKAIRLSNTVFQWSPDGRTWYQQPETTAIPWGHITGDITTQEDLMAYFTNINTSLTSIDGNITSINNTITDLQSSLGTLNTSFNSHLTEYASYKNQVSTSLSEIRRIAEDATGVSTDLEEELEEHIEDTNNPHHISKSTIGLGNVDNTADLNKPLSTPQKTYVDTEIEKVKEEAERKANGVTPDGAVTTLFVGNADQYSQVSSYDGLLAFVLDDTYITTNIVLTYTNYDTFTLYEDNVALTPTTSITGQVEYEDLDSTDSVYKLAVSVDGETVNYNLSVKFALTTNLFNIDEIVEGGNE